MACIMNAISYLNGDAIITDMPSCADKLLAAVAMRTNDNLCTHRGMRRIKVKLAEVASQFAHLNPEQEVWVMDPALTEDAALLCNACSALMWQLGTRIIGTADVWKDRPDRLQQNCHLMVVDEVIRSRFDRIIARRAGDRMTTMLSRVAWQLHQAVEAFIITRRAPWGKVGHLDGVLSLASIGEYDDNGLVQAMRQVCQLMMMNEEPKTASRRSGVQKAIGLALNGTAGDEAIFWAKYVFDVWESRANYQVRRPWVEGEPAQVIAEASGLAVAR